MTPHPSTAVRRFVLVAITLPAVLTLVSLILQLAMWPSLPDPIATHWGLSGGPDGFGPIWVPLVLTVAVGLGVPLLLAASVLNGLRRGDRGVTYRFLGAVALGSSTLIAVLVTWTTLMQTGVADAVDAPSATLPAIVAFLAAAGAGLVGWRLQPDEPYRASAPADLARVALEPSERVVWLQSVRIAVAGIVVLSAALVLLIVSTLIMAILGAPLPAVLMMAGVTLLMVLAIAMATAFHVRVDETGLSVTSVFGFPRIHIPLEDVDRVSAVQVSPMGEFGGWGLRWAIGGGFGVVLRTGEGIRVQRRSGKVFTVTVDDAETGAAVLAALADRAARR